MLPVKSTVLTISEITSEIDLVELGGVGRGASCVWVTTAGLVWLVGNDNQGHQFPLIAHDPELARQGGSGWKELAIGTAAVLTETGGTYPAEPAAEETIVLRCDEDTIKDTGDVTVTFAAGSYTLAQIATAINAAIWAALVAAGTPDTTHVFASDASGQLRITGRAHGTAGAVEIVSVGATLATATGLAAGTTNGTNSGGATGTVVVEW